MVVTGCNTSNMKTSLQTSFIAGFTGSWIPYADDVPYPFRLYRFHCIHDWNKFPQTGKNSHHVLPSSFHGFQADMLHGVGPIASVSL